MFRLQVLKKSDGYCIKKFLFSEMDVYVGQLPFATTEDDLNNFFYSAGSVKTIKFFPVEI